MQSSASQSAISLFIATAYMQMSQAKRLRLYALGQFNNRLLFVLLSVLSNKNKKLTQFVGIVLFSCVTLSAQAGFEEGVQAYRSRNYEMALGEFKSLAEAGESRAQAMLGVMYEYGDGVEKNEVLAVKLYLQAAQNNYALAQRCLGRMYLLGKGVAQNKSLAVEWIRKAAIQKESAAENDLGVLYEFGDGGLPRDYQQAVIWYQKAAESGDSLAQQNLAQMYERGLGVTKDDKQALHWHRKAAATRHIEGLDARSVKIDYFIKAIAAKIKNNIALPSYIEGNPEVTYAVTLLPNGEILTVSMAKTSGNSTYDRAVETAIYKSNPLPIPAEYDVFSVFSVVHLKFRPFN